MQDEVEWRDNEIQQHLGEIKEKKEVLNHVQTDKERVEEENELLRDENKHLKEKMQLIKDEKMQEEKNERVSHMALQPFYSCSSFIPVCLEHLPSASNAT